MGGWADLRESRALKMGTVVQFCRCCIRKCNASRNVSDAMRVQMKYRILSEVVGISKKIIKFTLKSELKVYWVELGGR